MARYSVDYDGNLDTTDDRVSYGSFNAAVGGLSDRGFGSYGVQDNRSGGGGNLGSFDVGSGGGWAALNDARQVGGGLFGGGGLLGGFFNPGRMVGSGIGTLVAGPIGGILGGLIGGGIGRNRQQGGWGYTDAEGNRVSAFRDMFDGGGRGRFGDTFQGGLLSNVANNMGIRPAGYRARQAAMGQQQPDYVGEMAAPVAGGGVVPASGGASLGAAPADLAPMSSPMPIARPTFIPINENGLIAGSGQTPANGYVPAPSGLPINMRGIVTGSGQTPATGYVPMPMANPPAPLPAGTTLPRATPSLSALEAYIASDPRRSNPDPMWSNPSPQMIGAAPVAMPGRSDPLVYPLYGQRIGSPDINLRSNRFTPRMPTPPRDPNPYASTFPPGLLRR